MPKPSMTVVWGRIAAHTGEQFKTKTGLPFSYSFHGNTLTTTRTDYPLARSEFEQVLKGDDAVERRQGARAAHERGLFEAGGRRQSATLSACRAVP